MFWTPEKRALALDMQAKGATNRAIATELGTSRNAVQRWFAARGSASMHMTGKAWSAEEDAQARQMDEAGATHAEIADAIGRSPHAVRDRIKRAPIVVSDLDAGDTGHVRLLLQFLAKRKASALVGVR